MSPHGRLTFAAQRCRWRLSWDALGQVPGHMFDGREAGRRVIASQALASGSSGNTPRVPKAEEIVALYREAWASGRNRS